MAAIKYFDPDTNKTVITTGAHSSSGTVLVRLKGGSLFRARLMGFFYSENKRLEGQYVKIVATEITYDSGNQYSVWRPVAPDESVLGWVALGMRGFEDCGIYGVSDAKGWPIIVKPKASAAAQSD